MKSDGINIIISLLRGKSKKDMGDMKEIEAIDEAPMEEKIKREGKIYAPPQKKKSYKDDYEDMGDSGIQMRKRSGGKRFTIGE